MNSTIVATCYFCGPEVEHDTVFRVTRSMRVNGSYDEALRIYNAYNEDLESRAARMAAQGIDDVYIRQALESRLNADEAQRMLIIRRNHLSFRYEDEEVDVCLEHLRECEWCNEPYTNATRHGEIWHWNSHGEVFDSRGVIPWNFDDQLCFSCAEDARECDSCEELMRSGRSYYLDYNDCYYCRTCYDECTFHCEFCDWRVSDGHDVEQCSEEHDEDYGGDSLVHSYSYKPKPIFFTDNGTCDYVYDKHTPYMGFELEVEFGSGSMVTNGAAHVTEALDNHAYLKHDGSISRGFEIVTHPHTLGAYQNHFDWSFLEWLSNNGALSWRTDTCGLHVHISRVAFRSLVHQALFTYLIQNNKQQMTRLAGRTSHWAKFGDDDSPVPKKVKGEAWDRYQAVNMLNRSTVEIRIFKGSLMKRRVLMALELVNACFEYTRLMTVNDYVRGNTSWGAFAKWVKTRKEYDNLNYYIRLYNLYDNHTVTTN